MHMVDCRPSPESILFWVCKLPLFAILAALLILALLVQPDSIVARGFSNRVLVWIGKLSYSLYLWHHFAIHRADDLRPYIADLLYALPYSRYCTALTTGAVGIAFTLGLAMTSYYVVERPFLKLKKLTERVIVPSPTHAGAG
jgi:peptidoglycan/LPS O-acetylase OafA/YrhL